MSDEWRRPAPGKMTEDELRALGLEPPIEDKVADDTVTRFTEELTRFLPGKQDGSDHPEPKPDHQGRDRPRKDQPGRDQPHDS